MSRVLRQLLSPGMALTARFSTRTKIVVSTLLLLASLCLSLWPGVEMLEGASGAQAPPLAAAVKPWFEASFIAAGVMAVLNIYLMFSICMETRCRLESTSQHLQSMSAGRLDIELPENGSGEATQLARRINHVARSLRDMVGRIVLSSRDVATAGDDMSMSAQTLAIRSDEQAQVIQQTSQAVHDVLQAVQHTADMAQQVNQVSSRLSEQADESKSVVDSVVAAMGRIKGRTDEMTAALGVIDALTFQTNILALNAAVEAARAGPSGRGFSVVAAEVRALAKRTAEAAKDIKETIERSNAEVSQGVKEVHSVKAVIQGVSDGFRDVSQQMRDVSSSNMTQSAAISLISQGLDQLSDIATANNELVAASVSSSENLRSSAQELMALVSLLEGERGPDGLNAAADGGTPDKPRATVQARHAPAAASAAGIDFF